MKLWRGLSKRILIVSVLCALIGLLLAQAFTLRAAREALRISIAPYIHHSFGNTERKACEADPEHWSLDLEPGVRLDAYDDRTLASRNPTAPPLDEILYRRLEQGEPHPLRLYRFGGEQGGAILMRTGEQSGPCALVQATLPPHPVARRRRSGLLLALGVVVMSLAACIAFVIAVRPLTARIERLRRAAQRVGAPEGYVSSAIGAGDELDELSRMLDGAHERIRRDAARLEERQRALERYLADVAHDLRTPIGSLQLALEQSLDARTESDRAELLQTALKDVIYLSGLTNNLRLACQLKDGWDPLAGDPLCDLADTVERVAARGRVFARRSGIELDLARPDGPVLVRCHPTAVEQAVDNVVQNAIAYGDPGGHVAIVLEPLSGGARFSLTIVDDGPGVLPTELPRLGERTFRSDEARQRDPHGSGLGLAITSEISARSGWSLSFASESPRGLRVTIEGSTADVRAP